MPSSKNRAEAASGRREAILTAALALFDDQGIEVTTLDQIRAGSGASVGSLYHHFGGKEQIVDALRARAVTSWADAVLGAMERARSARTGLERGIAAHLDFVDRHTAMAMVMLSGETKAPNPSSARQLASANKAVAVRLGSWLDRHTRTGEIRSLAPELYASMILGPCLELARLRLSGRSSLSPSQAGSQLAELVWSAIRA